MKCVFFFKKERPEWESTQQQRTQETDCLPRKGVLRSRDLQRIRKQKLNIIYSLDPSWPFACLVCLSRSRLLSPPGSSTLLSGGWPPHTAQPCPVRRSTEDGHRSQLTLSWSPGSLPKGRVFHWTLFGVGWGFCTRNWMGETKPGSIPGRASSQT